MGHKINFQLNVTSNLMSTYFFPEADGPPCSFILSTQEGAQEGSYLCCYRDTCHELTFNGSVVGSFDDIRKSTCIRPPTQGPFVRPSLPRSPPPSRAWCAQGPAGVRQSRRRGRGGKKRREEEEIRPKMKVRERANFKSPNAAALAARAPAAWWRARWVCVAW